MLALFVSKDKGNALAGVQVAKEVAKRGVTITYQLSGTALHSYKEDEGFRAQFRAFEIRDQVWDPPMQDSRNASFDFAFVTLSASGRPNGEIDTVFAANDALSPVYGLEEVVGGRHNPGWEDESPSPVMLLNRLFTALPTDEDAKYPNVTVVGPPQLNRYRNADIDALGAQARQNLGIPEDCPLIYYSGQPEPENPHVLSRLGEALACLRRGGALQDVCLVVSRHARERSKTVPDNGIAHRHALRLIRDRVGIRVFENSLEHVDLPAAGPEGIPWEFRPPEFSSYQELVCACKRNGVVVTGFGNDDQVVAPHLGIPSILYLDRVDYLFGGLLKREKKLSRLPVPIVPQVTSVESLAAQLERFLLDPVRRRAHCQLLTQTFPFPQTDPAEKIAELILEDLSKQ